MKKIMDLTNYELFLGDLHKCGSRLPKTAGTKHNFTVKALRTINLKPAVFGCLTNAIAPPAIALESCPNPQKMRQVF